MSARTAADMEARYQLARIARIAELREEAKRLAPVARGNGPAADAALRRLNVIGDEIERLS